jgi:radical SAM superfamily enzyme YgiQ (UPF0313 family)
MPVRYASAEKVIEEIEYLVDKYNIELLFFNDDDFIVNKSRLKKITALMEKKGLHQKLSWRCQAGADSVDLETLNMIKKAGCRVVNFGFESGCQRVLDLLKNRRVSVEQNRKAVELAKKVGLIVVGAFMFGTPTETREEMEETLRFIRRSEIDFWNVAITTPYPGTKLWQWSLERHQISQDIDIARLTTATVGGISDAYVICDTMPTEEFRHFIEKVKRESKKWAHVYGHKRSAFALIRSCLRNPIMSLLSLLKYPKQTVRYLQKTLSKD